MWKSIILSSLLYLVIQRDLLGIQRLLNSTEFSVNRLTALLDCRGLHKVRSDSDRGTFLIGLLCDIAQRHLQDQLDSSSNISLCTSCSLTFLDTIVSNRLYSPPLHGITCKENFCSFQIVSFICKVNKTSSCLKESFFAAFDVDF